MTDFLAYDGATIDDIPEELGEAVQHQFVALSAFQKGTKGKGKGRRGKGRGRKGKGSGDGNSGKGSFPVRRSALSLADRKAALRKLKMKTKCLACGETGHWKGDPECKRPGGAGSGKGSSSGFLAHAPNMTNEEIPTAYLDQSAGRITEHVYVPLSQQFTYGTPDARNDLCLEDDECEICDDGLSEGHFHPFMGMAVRKGKPNTVIADFQPDPQADHEWKELSMNEVLLLKQGQFPSIGDAEDEEMAEDGGDISSEDWQVVEHALPGTVEKGT